MNEQMMMDFGVGLIPSPRPKPRVTLDSVIDEPVRGGEPKPITQVMEPFERIMAHPDRNRLMAEFFKRYWQYRKPANPTYEQLIEYWEKRFWCTEFSHLGGGENPTRDNLVIVTKAAANAPFDPEQLKPVNKTLKNLFK